MPPLSDLTLYAVVALVGIPAALRSPVAFVLVVWWLAGAVTGLLLPEVPVAVNIALDVTAAMAVLFLVANFADAAVFSLFATSICAYLLHAGGQIDGWTAWAVTWATGVVQFLIAGAGAMDLRGWSDAMERRRHLHDDVRRFFAVPA